MCNQLKKLLSRFKVATSAQQQPDTQQENRYCALNAGVFLVPYY